MSDNSSNPRITITLGRGGQVVNRGVSHADFLPLAGTKRSVRDRLGSSADSGVLHGRQLENKRQREDFSTSSSSSSVFCDGHIRKDDLRYKLMQKNAAKRAQNTGKVVDLREKLSKAAGPPPSTPTSSSYTQDNKLPEPRGSSLLGPTPPARSTDNLPRIDTARSSYSPWAMEHVWRRPPDRVLGASRNHSPQRNVGELQRTPTTRTMENGRPVQYMGSEILESSRTSSSSPYISRSIMPSGSSAKPVAQPLSQCPLPSAAIKNSPYMVSELTVDGLLNSLGLGKYAIIFKAEEIDMPALKQMGEKDLKELGIPMGPRKKLLLALLPRSKQQQ